MDKSRRLLLALEGLALLVATVLILVDYKLKNDLVDLYKKMEGTLERGRQFMGQDTISVADTADVRSGNMVDDGPLLETPANRNESNGSSPASRTRKRASANGSAGIGRAPIPRFDNGLGS